MMLAVVETSVTRTLALALRSIGGIGRLAEYLGVPEAELAAWLQGSGRPPTRVYMRALDLVARGPFSPPHDTKSS